MRLNITNHYLLISEHFKKKEIYKIKPNLYFSLITFCVFVFLIQAQQVQAEYSHILAKYESQQNLSLYNQVDAEPALVSCKLDRNNNVLELRFKNLQLSSSDVEITIQSNTGERIIFTSDNYEKADEVFVVPIQTGQLRDATTLVVTSFYVDVFKNPTKISIEKKQTEITKL